MGLAHRGRWLVLLVVVEALGSCKRSSESPVPVSTPAAEAPPAAAPAPVKPTWSAESMDGRARVRQRETGPNTCVVDSTGGERWSVQKCLGGPALLYFVSPDGQALLVVDPLPLGPDAAWANATVASLYVRGELTKQTTAGALVLDDKRLMRFQKRFAWAAGTGGLPGAPPAYVGADEVGGTTADGRAFRFGFDGSGIPDPASRPRADEVRLEDPVDPPRMITSAPPPPADEPVYLPTPQPNRQPEREVVSYCTYPERAGSRNFFMCIRAPPPEANGICSREMSAQYESRVTCTCQEDRSGECRKLLQ
jgi:hypothetical protein